MRTASLLEKTVEEKEEVLRERGKILAERDKVVKAKDQTLLVRDNLDNALTVAQKELGEVTSKVAEKDERIRVLEADLAARDERLRLSQEKQDWYVGKAISLMTASFIKCYGDDRLNADRIVEIFEEDSVNMNDTTFLAERAAGEQNQASE